MRNGLARLGSLRLTAVALAGLMLAAAPAIVRGEADPLHLAIALGVLELNLVAAIVTNATFRRQFALLAFHVALALMVGLVAVGRLTFLTGYTEIVEGEAYAGLLDVRAGPLQNGRAEGLRFANERVRVSYHPGPVRDATQVTVRYWGPQGRPGETDIGDHRPLLLDGFRIYATFNKGFAPVLAWWPDGGGGPVRGSVNLPRFPGEQDAQWREWVIPGTTTAILTGLVIDGAVLDPAARSVLRPPARHRLVVRHADARHELQRGERLVLPGGVLVYEELRMWMGFQITNDWTTPWVLAAAVVAVLCLGAHFWARYAVRPWTD